MKNIYLLSLLLVSSLLLNAQDKTKEEVIQIIADDTCECLSDKDKFIGKSSKEKQMVLGLCLINSYNKHKKESTYFDDYPVTNFEALGEEVGMLLMVDCSDGFFSVFGEDELLEYMEKEDDFSSGRVDYSESEILTVTFTLEDLDNNIISSITMSDDYNKNHTFIILNEVNGLEDLKKSNFKKPFLVEFYELDIFDLSEMRYIKKKILKSIKKV